MTQQRAHRQALMERFGKELAAAQHQDTLNSWPWIFRTLHRTFIRWSCPACQYWYSTRKRGANRILSAPDESIKTTKSEKE